MSALLGRAGASLGQKRGTLASCAISCLPAWCGARPVLELGCGRGRIALARAEAGLETTGVDISDGILRGAYGMTRTTTELSDGRLFGAIRCRHSSVLRCALLPRRLCQKAFGNVFAVFGSFHERP